NPRVVPRYHSRLTKLTSRCCVVMVNTTSRKKNRSRKRREMVAAKMPHKTAAGRTVKPRKFLASDIGGSALQVTHPPVTPLPATKPDLAWGQYCVCPLTSAARARKHDTIERRQPATAAGKHAIRCIPRRRANRRKRRLAKPGISRQKKRVRSRCSAIS